ncbi:hypothetical protein HYH03_018269 [Edaphochlamys debaryana]|uniref:Apple domain-containing protein n=1 Tax=Edaphochlamys debaryana TaxID=47281 RepID=A0A836BNG5_9CHLO|nr:hypothetical protein HYH03_018269 [Edaphochlamys debaryana]|eukprot:KAG2482832.1 hypothetical protein HYH03_018269 [Edaphochlamys debaryana]
MWTTQTDDRSAPEDPIVCPDKVGYITKAGLNWASRASGGQDADPADAEARCNRDPKCTAWNNFGYYLNGKVDKWTAYGSLCSYEKKMSSPPPKPLVCPKKDGYITKTGLNWVSKASGGQDADPKDAEARCNRDPKCTAWNSFGYYVNGKVDKWTAYGSLCSYEKIVSSPPPKPLVCPKKDGYITKTGLNWVSKASGGQDADPKDAEARCNRDPKCTAWNSFGYYVNGKVDKWTAYGSLCSYEKIVSSPPPKPLVCPKKDGYITKTGLNWVSKASGGQDADPKDAEARCNRDPKCTAWNSFGYYVNGKVDKWTAYGSLCSYEKIVCPDKDGYITKAGQNWESKAPGGQDADPNDAEARCNADPKCTAWNSFGYYQNGKIDSWTPYSSLCSYEKKAPLECPEKAGYTVVKGKNWVSAATGGSFANPADAEAYCNANAECTTWNSYGYYLNGKVDRWTDLADMCTYEKVVCPEKLGYITKAGFNWESKATGGQDADPADAEARCNANPKCTAWNSFGYYVNGKVDSWSMYGSLCSYEKIVCPDKDGYITRAGANWESSEADGTGGQDADPKDAEARCNADPKCTAWNSFGYWIDATIDKWTPYGSLCSYEKKA